MPTTVPAPFTCEPVPERDRVRIHVMGEIDIATVDVVQRSVDEILEAGFRRLVLDLRDVTFMDSTGLHLLLTLDSKARGDGVSFSVIPGPPDVLRVMTLAGVAGRLTFEAPPLRRSQNSATGAGAAGAARASSRRRG